MLFLGQHGYEALLARELGADGLTVIETGPGWAGAEPLPGDVVPQSVDELAFPHLTLLAPREMRGESVNALAQQLADYFLERTVPSGRKTPSKPTSSASFADSRMSCQRRWMFAPSGGSWA